MTAYFDPPPTIEIKEDFSSFRDCSHQSDCKSVFTFDDRRPDQDRASEASHGRSNSHQSKNHLREGSLEANTHSLQTLQVPRPLRALRSFHCSPLDADQHFQLDKKRTFEEKDSKHLDCDSFVELPLPDTKMSGDSPRKLLLKATSLEFEADLASVLEIKDRNNDLAFLASESESQLLKMKNGSKSIEKEEKMVIKSSSSNNASKKLSNDFKSTSIDDLKGSTLHCAESTSLLLPFPGSRDSLENSSGELTPQWQTNLRQISRTPSKVAGFSQYASLRDASVLDEAPSIEEASSCSSKPPDKRYKVQTEISREYRVKQNKIALVLVFLAIIFVIIELLK